MRYNEKKISFRVGCLLAVVFVMLSVAEYRSTHMAYSEAWRLYFTDPMGENMVFEIFNETENREFRYVIYEEKRKIAEGVIFVDSGERKRLDVREQIDPTLSLEGKIRVLVRDSSGGEREIFRIL